MKKLRLLFLFFFILSIYNCKSESDIIATYKEGNITRGEFYKWIDNRRIARDSILKKKANQKIKLRQIAIDKLSYNEAVKAGYDKDKDIVELLDIVKQNSLSGYLTKKLRNDVDFKEMSAKVRIIKLSEKNFKMENNKRVNLSKKDLDLEVKKQEETAKIIIDKLIRKESFEKLANTYSDDVSKKDGGDIGYIAEGMREPQLVSAAIKLNPGEFSKEPVRINNALFIIKVDDKKELTGSNIDSIIGDKTKSERLKKRLQFNKGKSLENNLLNSTDVQDLIDKGNYNAKDSVLFKIANESFTSSQLNRIIELTNKRGSDSGMGNENMDIARKKQFAKRILSQKLLSREAVKRGADKEQEYMRDWDNIREYTVANEYKNDILLKDVKITDKEIKEEYDKNKDRAYKRKVKKGANTVDEIIPFNEVKERIKNMLINRNKSLNRRKWEEDLLNKTEFKINENKLDGD